MKSPPLYQSDIRPLEFTLAVTIGGVGSAVLSGLRVHPLVSVGFALIVMLVLAFLRWRIASEFNDFESLEAFAEDIYLLGYLLTLAALLGLAPRLMSDDANLFNIAGLKLVTTVVGLALMMIFRQTARRWAAADESGAAENFREQQRVFNDSVARLNNGADALTTKLDEVVRRFDPGLLVPVAEWSNRAVGAFGAAAKAFELVPASVEKSVRCLNELDSDLEKVKSAAAHLAGVLTAETSRAAGALAAEFGHASRAANALGGAVVALQPASEAARGGLEKLSVQAGIGVAQFGEISGSLDRVAVELGKVEGVLKGITDVNTTDVKAPINRLVEALDASAAKTMASTEHLVTLKGELEGVRTASQDLAQAMGSEIAKPLMDNQKAVDRAQQQVARAEEQMGRLTKQLEAVVSGTQPREELMAQLLVRLGELQSELKETNVQVKAVLQRVEQSSGLESKSGFFSFFRGGR